MSPELPEFYRRFQPVTWWIGVVEAPKRTVVSLAESWLAPDGAMHGQQRLRGQIDEFLHALEPLGNPNRLLFVSTADDRTAVFASGLIDTVTAPVSHLGRLARARAIRVCCQPHTISLGQRRGVWGGTIIEVYDLDPDATVDGYGAVRSIAAANDAGRWRFDVNGKPMPFEDISAYAARRVRDRFSPALLLRYCAALRVPVYDESFYGSEATLMRRGPDTAGLALSFEQAQRHLNVATPGD